MMPIAERPVPRQGRGKFVVIEVRVSKVRPLRRDSLSDSLISFTEYAMVVRGSLAGSLLSFAVYTAYAVYTIIVRGSLANFLHSFAVHVMIAFLGWLF